MSKEQTDETWEVGGAAYEGLCIYNKDSGYVPKCGEDSGVLEPVSTTREIRLLPSLPTPCSGLHTAYYTLTHATGGEVLGGLRGGEGRHPICLLEGPLWPLCGEQLVGG